MQFLSHIEQKGCFALLPLIDYFALQHCSLTLALMVAWFSSFCSAEPEPCINTSRRVWRGFANGTVRQVDVTDPLKGICCRRMYLAALDPLQQCSLPHLRSLEGKRSEPLQHQLSSCGLCRHHGPLRKRTTQAQASLGGALWIVHHVHMFHSSLSPDDDRKISSSQLA